MAEIPLEPLASQAGENFRPNVDFVPTEQVTKRYKNLGHNATRLLVESRFDSLTGLANERMFEARLEQSIERENTKDLESGEDTNLAVLYIDVDAFKKVNDSLGHGVGDETLQLIAQELRTGVRSSDVPAIEDADDHAIAPNDVAREHGDEFKILVPKVTPDNPKNVMTPEERLEAMKNRLRASIEEAIEQSPHAAKLKQLGVGISIGSVIYKAGEDPKDFVARADEQMRIDKQRRNKSR